MIKILQFLVANDFYHYKAAVGGVLKNKDVVGNALQIKTQLFNDITSLYGLYSELVEESSNLARLTASPYDSYLIANEPLAPYGQWSLSSSDSIKLALKNREEILAANNLREAQLWQQRKYTRSYLPVISAVGYISTFYDDGYLNVPSSIPFDGLSQTSIYI